MNSLRLPPSGEAQAKTKSARQFEYLDIDQIKNMPNPQWLVDRLVIERSLGFIYGPPGCLKTFIALDMALSFATGGANGGGARSSARAPWSTFPARDRRTSSSASWRGSSTAGGRGRRRFS